LENLVTTARAPHISQQINLVDSQLKTSFQGKRVLVTGHTGFKGSWLCEWLLALGAEIAGYALDPQPHELLFSQLNLGKRLAQDHRGNLSNRSELNRIVADFAPDIVLHLAAQPLVRLSYSIPVETFGTNVMGTVHLLEAVRLAGNPCAVVSVTTDKCYENREWLHAYREEDAMGGHDPYSASKGAAELVIASYRKSFFAEGSVVRLASARAGNVIGGGDWAVDRIIPDCIRSVGKGEPILVRNRIATRPWQHVLEPLSGYLWLAASLSSPPPSAAPESFCAPFNFGPLIPSNRTVAELVTELLLHIGGEWQDHCDPSAPHEASKLNLATDKAFHLLDWQPVWGFGETVAKTAQWYLAVAAGNDAGELTRNQIESYTSAAVAKQLPWAS
jgi:CDP-glucose 4,6-dehydratase